MLSKVEPQKELSEEVKKAEEIEVKLNLEPPSMFSMVITNILQR